MRKGFFAALLGLTFIGGVGVGGHFSDNTHYPEPIPFSAMLTYEQHARMSELQSRGGIKFINSKKAAQYYESEFSRIDKELEECNENSMVEKVEQVKAEHDISSALDYLKDRQDEFIDKENDVAFSTITNAYIKLEDILSEWKTENKI